MAQKGIREYDAKRMLARNIKDYSGGAFTMRTNYVLVTPETKLSDLGKKNSWLKKTKLVAKPDQLFGKRGKHKLLLLDADLSQAQKWLSEKMGKTVTVGKTTGTLETFLIEPFVPHEEEWYVAIKTARDHDTVYFSTRGGVDVEENWKYVKEIAVPIDGDIDTIDVEKQLPKEVPADKRDITASFIRALYKFFVDFHFTYLEINPFTFDGKNVVPLDLVARVDDTAEFECFRKWGKLEFPQPFGMSLRPEEAYVKDLDAKSGASLKLTILNPEGRVWTMVAGGGASVIYADTISDLGFAKELANYGEYSGNPNTELTYLYAKTVIDLMTRKKAKKGKVLIIGGGIANFTDVAKTFTGIIQALREKQKILRDHKIKIFVRRGGPNYKEGLENMRNLGEEINVPIDVYGPETHMTKVVPMALKEAK